MLDIHALALLQALSLKKQLLALTAYSFLWSASSECGTFCRKDREFHKPLWLLFVLKCAFYKNIQKQMQISLQDKELLRKPGFAYLDMHSI